ncbi:hypothetical protein TH8_03195 [Thalassospira profundimaris]|nr:hypothetical protein TH8_03195 [Thalassospira profundimaris]
MIVGKQRDGGEYRHAHIGDLPTAPNVYVNSMTRSRGNKEPMWWQKSDGAVLITGRKGPVNGGFRQNIECLTKSPMFFKLS